MISTVCNITGNGDGIEDALNETEKVAAYEKLSKKETLQLRLLAEELTGIMRAVAGDFTAKFWIETNNNQFQLHLEANSSLSQFEKDQLISIAKGDPFTPATTFMGKIGRIFETLLKNYDETNRYSLESGVMLPYSEGMATSILSENEVMRWSLEKYKAASASAPSEDGWDELEKSIVANLADDVIVHVKNKKAEIIVCKKFENRD